MTGFFISENYEKHLQYLTIKLIQNSTEVKHNGVSIGNSGNDAISRILGFFILAIGIQLLSDGFFSLIETSGLILN